jgi:hypothetical protein
MEAAVGRMWSKAMQIQHASFERRLIREAMQSVIGDWSKLAPDNVEAVARAICERYAKYALDFRILKPETQA